VPMLPGPIRAHLILLLIEIALRDAAANGRLLGWGVIVRGAGSAAAGGMRERDAAARLHAVEIS